MLAQQAQPPAQDPQLPENAQSAAQAGQSAAQDAQAPGAGVDVDSILRGNDSSRTFFEGPASVQDLVVAMVIGLGLALILQWHYRRFATTLSNKENFAKVFPFILLTTLLIITVVKSSLALSLGLVGALSIVRFRTPIKEPEELAYLFICIAIGLGLGALQILATLAGSAFVLVAAGILALRRRGTEKKNLYLSVNWAKDRENAAVKIDALNAVVSEHVTRCDLRRVDSRDGVLEAHYLVEISTPKDLTALMDRLYKECNVDLTFVDQSSIPTG